jgi:hypothetical protein
VKTVILGALTVAHSVDSRAGRSDKRNDGEIICPATNKKRTFPSKPPGWVSVWLETLREGLAEAANAASAASVH